MKQILTFLAKLAVLILLTQLTRDPFTSGYQQVLAWCNWTSYEIPFMGAQTLYPFFILILATPGLSVRRRIVSMAAAGVLYLVIDLGVIHLWQVLPYARKAGDVPAKVFYTNVYYMFMNWLLPFLLWIVCAHRQIEELCRNPFRRTLKIP